jgi:regulator of replication initiation timing
MSNQQSQVSVDVVKQLYDSLLELRQSVRDLLTSSTAEELEKEFDRLHNIVSAIADFEQTNEEAWTVRVSSENELEITYLYDQLISESVAGNSSMTLADVLQRFFSEQSFINVLLKMLVMKIGDIAHLVKTSSGIYEKIAELDSKIDQLYRDIKKMCQQQDP